MSVYSIHFSPTGGTKKVMDCLNAAFGPVTEIDLSCRSEDFSRWHFTREDLCLVGMPVFGGRFPAIALERFAQLQADGTPCALVAVYGNRAIDDALIELFDLARENGFVPVAGVEAVAKHSLFPQVATERPDAADIAQLKDFSAQILAAARTPALAEIPGNRPYKPRKPNGFFPAPTENCTRCSYCAEVCPTGAIDLLDPAQVDPAKCIGCMRCVTQCPEAARIRPPEKMAAAWERLAPVFAGHKPNRIYLAK